MIMLIGTSKRYFRVVMLRVILSLAVIKCPLEPWHVIVAALTEMSRECAEFTVSPGSFHLNTSLSRWSRVLNQIAISSPGCIFSLL